MKYMADQRKKGYIFAIAFFILLPLALHSPIWTGRTDFFSGMASDLVPYVYGLKQLQYQTIHQCGELPLWNPHILLGQPAVGNIQHALFYPLNALFWIFPFFTAVWIGQTIHMALAGCGSWLLARRTGCGPAAALTAGALFMLNGRILYYINAGWIGYLHALCWIPWVVWAGLVMLQDRKPRQGIIVGIFLALSLLSGTPQYALVGYCLLAFHAILYMSVPQANGNRWSLLWTLILAGLVFFTLSAIEIFPSAEQSFLSSRQLSSEQTLGFHFSWNLSQWVRILLRPEFVSQDFSWELCGYIGIGGMVLAFFGIWKNLDRWRLILIWGLIPVLLSMGPAIPVLDQVIQSVPGLSILTNPSRYFIFTVLTLSLASGWGLQALVDGRIARYRSALILAVLFLAIGLGVLVPTAEADGAASNKRFLIMLILSGFFIFSCGFRMKGVWSWLLVFCLLIDPLTLIPPLFTGYCAANLPKPERILAAIKKYPRPLRLAAIQPEHLRDNLISVIEDHETVTAGIDRIDGYEPLAMLRTLRFLSLMDGTGLPDRTMWGFRPFGFARPELFHLAGVTHLVTVVEQRHQGLFLVATDSISGPHFHGGLWQNQKIFLYEIRYALPPAFLIYVDGHRSTARVNLLRPSPNRRIIDSEASGPATVILTESFHNGWRAQVDGADVVVRPFLDTFIAVDVPDGEHRITLQFLPGSYITGRRITLVGLVMLLILGGYRVLMYFRLRPEVNPPPIQFSTHAD